MFKTICFTTIVVISTSNVINYTCYNKSSKSMLLRMILVTKFLNVRHANATSRKIKNYRGFCSSFCTPTDFIQQFIQYSWCWINWKMNRKNRGCTKHESVQKIEHNPSSVVMSLLNLCYTIFYRVMAHLSNGSMFRTPRRFPSIICSILSILNKLLKEFCGVFETWTRWKHGPLPYYSCTNTQLNNL